MLLLPSFLLLLGIAQVCVAGGSSDYGDHGYVTIKETCTVTETCTTTVYKPPVTITRCITVTKWIPKPLSSKHQTTKCPKAFTVTKTVTSSTTIIISSCTKTTTTTTTKPTTVISVEPSGTTIVTLPGVTTTDPGVTTTKSGPGTTISYPVAGSTTTVIDPGRTTTTTLDEFGSTTTITDPGATTTTTFLTGTSTPCYTLNQTFTKYSDTLTLPTTQTILSFSTKNDSSHTVDTGGVIGIAIACTTIGAAIAGLLAFCLPRRRPSRPSSPAGYPTGGEPSGGYAAEPAAGYS